MKDEAARTDGRIYLFGNEECHFQFGLFRHKVRFHSGDPIYQECTNKMESKNHYIKRFLCGIYIQNFHRENRNLVHIFLL